MIKRTILVATLFLVISLPVYSREHFFQVQSIDTMKFSRDVAREKLNDANYDKEIEKQIKNIADTGATHVAVATPYDSEFIPYLKRWVNIARRYGLKLWFRGNFSGWEKWFDYPKIDRNTHLLKTKEFILSNPGLFEDGDIFTSCPECENGGNGDPRQTRDIDGFRNFIIAEYRTTKEAFAKIGKNVKSNYYSMNGDVAGLIMNEETTAALDGVVTVDHYVKTSDKLVSDIGKFADLSNGKVVLGEFGAPIPDINGDMDEIEQARWINEAMKKLIKLPELITLNYWTNTGSSTQLWNDDGSPRQAVKIISSYFNPLNVSGIIKDEQRNEIKNVTVKSSTKKIEFENGQYALPVLTGESINFSKAGYISLSINVGNSAGKDIKRDIVLIKLKQPVIASIIQIILEFLHKLFGGNSK